MKQERPKVVEGQTPRRTTGCGHLYVTVNTHNGTPLEVFAHLGKNGGCARAQNEALTRAITLGLRYGVPVAEFVEELKDIRCSSPNLWPEEERALSCADAIARVLRDYESD